ncbi:MAG: hypothetical protein JNM70_05570 [Anaerolineae bacterium]|nr:hypothetical protein [Anaerolineae bacterium]
MDDFRPHIDEGAFELDTADAFAMPDDPYSDDWFLSEPPPDLDYAPDLDPWLPDDDRFVPTDTPLRLDLPPVEQDGLQGLEPPEPADAGWRWHDARLIGVECQDESGIAYEIGCIDLYANLHTGDLGGSYLLISTFDDADVAAAFFHDLQSQIQRDGLLNQAIPAFAEQAATRIHGETPAWGSASGDEYQAYSLLSDLEQADPDTRDLPPAAALDPLLEEALRLGGVVQEVSRPVPSIDDPSAFQALSAIGIQAEGFEPTRDPPPFYDAETGTAYWIGVFQPDPADTANCLTSILSLGRGADGELQAQLAPCVPGDWDKAYSAAEYLIQVAEKGGIDRCFDAAEGMALATEQRERWSQERGVPLAPEATRGIADYARQEWEVEL